MKIGVYASLMAGERGHESNVSGHIQVPLHTVRLLHEAGHEVHLITNRFGPRHALPHGIPGDVRVHLVEDGRKRPEVLRGGGSGQGLRPGKLVRQILQIRRIVARERLDVLHVFGLGRSAVFAGALKVLGCRAPVAATLVAGNFPARPGRVQRRLLGRLDAVIASTRHAACQCENAGVAARIVRHGVIRDLSAELGATPTRPRHRVLFWRDPNWANGADLCVDAFTQLAPEFPEVSFDLAIRPTRFEVPGIAELEAAHENVHVYRFPYGDGVSLPMLVAESMLILLPFRALTVDPQLAIAESLDAGVPVITTDLRSNPELVRDGETGVIVPVDALEPIVDAIRRLLHDRDGLLAMGSRTADIFRTEWNWNTYVRDLVQAYEEVTS